MSGELARFDPLIRDWFHQRIGPPTDIQCRAWPAISSGEHVLITAPTGSGKTLAAFLWAIDQLLTNQLPGDRVRVLYVSPLRALNNDVARNLLRPLEELQSRATAIDRALPPIRVAVRSGDTPESERRRMTRYPPEILITTPESLNLLLLSDRGRAILDGVATVILDEIHAVAHNKRGTYLMTAVERLGLLAGDFQRIALSATVRPLEVVAELVGGFEQTAPGVFAARPVKMIRSTDNKRFQVEVRCPANIREKLVDRSRMPALVDDIRSRVESNRSTLLFANNRKLTEKLARLLNADAEVPFAYSHHGSLSPEVRKLVEEKFKAGELSAIAATSSLELGIDIGDLDEVVLINTPKTVSSGIQRVGRAGHGVQATSIGSIYPTFEHGFLDAAVMAPLIAEQRCESIRPVTAPLDVLAQVIVAMCAIRRWPIDELFDAVRQTWAYRDLRRSEFDSVMEMLAGRYADSHIRELRPRLRIDRVSGVAEARKGARLLLYRSGGVIPDRGYYNIRLAETGALIGTLDEEFVWERKPGDTFTFGTQAWRVVKITHNDVQVSHHGNPSMAPFWRGEAIDRDFSLCEQIGLFLEDATQRLKDPSFEIDLRDRHHLDEPSVEELVTHLRRQAEATGPELPHRHHVVVEHYADPNNTTDSKRVILHAFWGGRILRPLAVCLTAAWEETHDLALEVVSSDEGLAINLPHAFSFDDLLNLVPPERLDQLLRMKLESTGYFGARFRENAARALLLPRQNLKKRMPLWLNRLRAQKLMNAVGQYSDFPILVETWRACVQDAFDLEGLRARLDELREGVIRVTEVNTTIPSPFSSDLVYQGTNLYMYLDDTPRSGSKTQLSDALIQEVLHDSALRPQLPAALVSELQAKLQRTHVGYAPTDADEILDLVHERLLIPRAEWSTLLQAVARDSDSDGDAFTEPADSLSSRVVRLALFDEQTEVFVAIERLGPVLRGFSLALDSVCLRGLNTDALSEQARSAIDVIFAQDRQRETGESQLTSVLSEVLRFYGPIALDDLADSLGVPAAQLEPSIEQLVDEGRLIAGLLVEGSERPTICDAENLERLLRTNRAAQRPSFEPLPLASMPHFLASLHGLTKPGETIEHLQDRLERLFGFVAPAALWESDVLPARMATYQKAWLDSTLQQSDLIWFGQGENRVSFCFRDWLDVFRAHVEDAAQPDDDDALGERPDDSERLLPTSDGRYDFNELCRHTGLDSASLTRRLWGHVWDGELSNDSLVALRLGVASKFKPIDAKTKSRRARFGSWKSSQPSAGCWYALPNVEPTDLLQEGELQRDRVRQLFARYGVLFRQRLKHEPKHMQWRAVAKTLRLMEFSGEALAGHFFQNIRGLQFIDHATYRRLVSTLPDDAIYWFNATDPISPCGLGLEAFKGELPSRLESTHLVYRGSQLQMVSHRHGRLIDLRLPSDSPVLFDVLAVLKVLLTRQFNPRKAITVETINGESAVDCPYTDPFKQFGFEKDYRELVLRKSYS